VINSAGKQNMITVLKIQCPHCFEVYELFLSTSAYVVVLNCPNCWTPIMHNKQGVHVLSDSMMERIRAQRRQNELVDLLDKMSSFADNPMPLHKKQHALPVLPSPSPHPVPNRDRECISRDDIVDLRIDLERCTDCRDFIEKL
jgi:hypothetical protein